MVHAQALSLRGRDYVLAARSTGAGSAFLTDAWVWWALPPGLCLLGLTLAGRALTGRRGDLV